MPPKTKMMLIGNLKKYIIANFTLATETSIDCRNGHILFIFINNGELFTKTVAKVYECFSINTCKNEIQNLVSVFKKWSYNFSRNATDIAEFCNKPFVFHAPVLTISHSLPLTSSPIDTVSCSSISSSENISFISPVSSAKLTPTNNSKNKQNLYNLREKMTPTNKKLQSRLFYLSSQLANSSKEQRYQIALLKSKLNNMPYKIKVLRQSVKRKEEIIKALRAEVRNLKQKFKSCYYNRRIRNLVMKKKEMKIEAREQLRQVMLKHNTVSRENKMEIARLENDMTQIEEVDRIASVTSGDNKAYSIQTRMIIYSMLLCNVPTGNIPILLKKIAQYFGVGLLHIPQCITVEQMARELGCISDMQAAEWAISNTNLTLGFDATTQEGVHINSVHLTSKSKCQVIALDQLPGGTSDDYEKHIGNAVDNMASIYSNFHMLSYDDCRSLIISNISNTMSDRVAANHLTISKLCEKWGKTLNELNCHLHPLDTIATECRLALKSLENEYCDLFGYDCMAVKIVLAMNKMRFKDVKGDPKGFVDFLDNNKLNRGIIPRYRGNRLHILFHTCYIFIKHYNDFLCFLTSGTVKCGTLQTVLRAAFCNTTAIKQMCVLGLFGKLLTGPWMTNFYVSAEDANFDHVIGIQVVKDVLETISDCKSNPAELFSKTTDFFEKKLPPKILEPITTLCAIDDQLIKMTFACLKAVEDVLIRQYERYFSISITSKFMEETASARLHNIDSEELMGMFSEAKGRSPNATICFISCKLRSKKNMTMDYLDSLDQIERENVVKWSIKAARIKRITNRLNYTALRAEISKRQTCKRQKMDEKEKRKLERELSLLSFNEIKNLYEHLSTKQLDDLYDLMYERIVGRELCHEWFDSDNSKSVIYDGIVEKVNKRKDNRIYTISYWKKDETDSEAVDHCMKKFQLAADIVSGELIFS
ncbi:uncharacterized protein LOC124808016 [Hydra vulgaris]|uniref:uncharacterized protein LOC124808016 n=1 Tax=Hydra vulgaris TaxID=6087 RepID=UPI001F5E671E|nr:uncharacterized protein LOC124808016 [Hydra vulgaris]XP_047126932.1 uncharacterized protein LOC124808016 [Hydra vulgaris]XP_047126933.1 uncharacterized protein LOC124808016 [Hydra vulgaris]XP_047126934.1 uncharacterized protein LOC124808016 [Hydra vulgaris]